MQTSHARREGGSGRTSLNAITDQANVEARVQGTHIGWSGTATGLWRSARGAVVGRTRPRRGTAESVKVNKSGEDRA